MIPGKLHATELFICKEEKFDILGAYAFELSLSFLSTMCLIRTSREMLSSKARIAYHVLSYFRKSNLLTIPPQVGWVFKFTLTL
ncbi:MAG: hypothetical protein ABI691_13195 [Ginsengibacter sp.]